MKKEEQIEAARKLLEEEQNQKIQECVNKIGKVLAEYQMVMQVAGDIRNPQIIIIPKQ